MSDEISTRGATISDDGFYRYDLTRRWGLGAGVTWVMLNPGTADAEQDNATVRRCMKFTRAWEYDCLVVVNLYAYRATDPKVLLTASDPLGPENMEIIRRRVQTSKLVIAAWGGFAEKVSFERARPSIASIARRYGVPLACLGRTKSGAPRHPLYVRGDKALEPYGPWVDQEIPA